MKSTPIFIKKEWIKIAKTYLKFLEVLDLDEKQITKRFIVMNDKFGEDIGIIKWYGVWRQYCFFSYTSVILHDGCAEELRNFLSQLKKGRKETIKKLRSG